MEVPEYSDVSDSKKLKISFTLKFINTVDLGDAIDDFGKKGTTETRPNDAISVVNTILGTFSGKISEKCSMK